MKIPTAQPRSYLAFVLSDESRAKLLAAVPHPQSKVIAHHVTIAFKHTPEKLKRIERELALEKGLKVVVTGYVSQSYLTVATVELNGIAGRVADTGFYHVTIALEPPTKPVESNDLLRMLDGAPTIKLHLELDGELTWVKL